MLQGPAWSSRRWMTKRGRKGSGPRAAFAQSYGVPGKIIVRESDSPRFRAQNDKRGTDPQAPRMPFSFGSFRRFPESKWPVKLIMTTILFREPNLLPSLILGLVLRCNEPCQETTTPV
jgi:hypothetical protein